MKPPPANVCSQPGRPFRIGASSRWYAPRFDVRAGRWTRRSTGETDPGRAQLVAERWRREGERLAERRLRDAAGSTRSATSDARRAESDGADDAEAIESTDDAGDRTPGAMPTRLVELVDQYVEFRRTHPSQPKDRHLRETRRILRRVSAQAGWTSPGEITLIEWQAALAAIAEAATDAGDAEAGGRARPQHGPAAPLRLANGTLNGYRAAWRAFASWLHVEGFTEKNALYASPRFKTKGFERVRRMALDVDQFHRLHGETLRLDRTHSSLDARARAALYLVAVCSGFRRGELAALTPRSFRRSREGRIMIDLEATAAKNAKPVSQPTLADVAAAMPWIESRDRDRLLWPGLRDTFAATMLRTDAEAAGVPVRSEDGRRLDFHSLRHTFSSWLVNVLRVHPKEAQTLMRHSSMELTMGVYTQVDAEQLGASIGHEVGAAGARNLARENVTTQDQTGRRREGDAAETPMESGDASAARADCESAQIGTLRAGLDGPSTSPIRPLGLVPERRP